MTDFNGNAMVDVSVLQTRVNISANNITNFIYFRTVNNLHTYYLMRAQDADCPLTYRVWVVVDTPDFNAEQYTGTKCGISPLTNIIIAAQWEGI